MARADWSQLPWDILRLVVTRFGIPHDLARFKSVCSSWKSFAAAHEQVCTPQFLAGLMLPGNKSHRHDFYCPLDDKTHKNLLHVPDDHLCRGNRDGWLITVSFSTKNVCILNPLSGDLLQTVRFPSLISLAERLGERNRSKYRYLFFDLVTRAVLSANPSEDQTASTCGLTMMVIFGDKKRLAYAREGAEAWVVVPEGEIWSSYEDINYYRNGFYAVNRSTVFFVDIDSSVPTVRVVIPPHEPEYEFNFVYLVESYDGELLLVSEVGEECHIVSFKVYQLDLKNEVKIEIPDLGDQCLFLGSCNTSLSIPSPEKFGLRKNCIYLADRCICIGVFDVGTKKFEKLYSSECYTDTHVPMWFTW